MPKSRKKRERNAIKTDSLTCKPLDSYSEIMLFLENPPPWRSLCKGMTPHSNYLIRNLEINRFTQLHSLEIPEHFCDLDPDMEEPARYEEKSLRKTMVCHDMANGYHDDSIIDGTDNYEGYTFYNWAGIDIFCYFSHHLITIPPVGWINMGHAHGVKVIGTIITEWADGINFWDQVLVSETEYQNLASALVAIAKILNFDGYLMNVENKISKPETLLEFVRYFHKLLHEELENAVLVWYDSVTIQGTINWQNKLNEKNKPFFDACDGFFTNYSWSVDDVTESAIMAEERVTDVFIGIDVWGRNFFGGGQFNTQEAIKVAHYSGCSIAIFAPAWSHEALSMEKDDPNAVVMGEYLDQFSLALLRDRALWGSIWPFLNTRVPCQLPFQTSFCRGLGKKRRLYGEVLVPSAWYNLRHQQYQPNAAHGAHGYVLSTLGRGSRAHFTYRDKKGILRYRSSYLLARRQSRAESRASVYSLAAHDSESASTTAKSDVVIGDSPQVKKQSIMNSLKNFFKHKSAKESPSQSTTNQTEASHTIKFSDEHGEKTDAGVSPPGENHETPAGPSTSNMYMPSTGRSMIATSVNLRLGASAEKHRYALGYVPDERECLQLYLDDSFTGGACLKINPSDKTSKDHRYIRLFFCDFSCEDTLVFCVVTKTLSKYWDQSLNVLLVMKNSADADLRVLLTGREVAYSTPLDRASSGNKYVYPLSVSEEAFRDLRTYLLLNEPGFYVPVENCFGWAVRYYQISVPGSRVTSIVLRTGLPVGGILLGHFGVCHRVIERAEDKPASAVNTKAEPAPGADAEAEAETFISSQQLTDKTPDQVSNFV